MIVDEAKLHIKAGHGGPGKVCFDTVPRSLGPTGGNGGNGGSVYAEGVSDLSALRQYRFKKEFSAEDGVRGAEAKRSGAAGADLILKVPIGTVIKVKLLNESQMILAEGSGGMHHGITEKEFEVTKVGEKILIAQGGLGGRGNFMFRSAHNPSPEYAQPGLPGEEFDAFFELRLIAQVGLIGLPNAGKSSLLNELTKAGAKVANYPFTTLEPNLGVYYSQSVLHASDEDQAKATPLILADIPGLIEGASTGKGLGHKFLRHVQRTKVLLHCVSAESADVGEDYKAVRDELSKYDKELVEKETYILLTKSDLVDEATITKQLSALKSFSAGGKKISVFTVSIHNQEQLAQIRTLLDGLAL
jgi:GTP-binding protein